MANNIVNRYWKKFILLVIIGALTALCNMYLFSFDSSDKTQTDPVVFGLVSCDPPTKKNRFVPLTKSLISSIIVSAKYNNVSSVRVHIFLESMEKAHEINSAVEEYCSGDCRDQIRIVFHSALDAVPKKYLKGMIYLKPYRCSFVRLFFSTLLPEEDAAIYLDLDTLVTGNVRTIWNRISKFTEHQVIAASQAAEKGQKDLNFFKYHFSDIPHVPPFGLNSGVLLMNLTKMRQINWSEKIFKTYDNFSKVAEMHCDQRVLNILLHFEPALLQQIPCNFNFMHGMCDHGQMCKEAVTDPEGIQIVHGSGGQIENKGWTFYELAEAYRHFNSSQQNVMTQLIRPIQKKYQTSRGRSKCFGSVHKLVFKTYS